MSLLNSRGIQHHTACSSKSFGGQVVSKLCTNDARVSVRASDLSPNYTDLGTIHLALCTVHVSEALTQIKVGLILCVDVLNLDQAGVLALVSLATLESKDAGLGVESIKTGQSLNKLVKVATVKG